MSAEPFRTGPRATRLFGQYADAVAASLQHRGLSALYAMAARMLGERPDPMPHAQRVPKWQRETLEALLGRLCAYGEGLPEVTPLGGVERALDFLGGMPAETQEEFLQLLGLLEAAPLVLGPARRRFTALATHEQDAHLEGWATSSLTTRRGAFRAIKSVAMMAYWTHPDTWDAIGYSLADNPGLPGHLRAPEAQRREHAH